MSMPIQRQSEAFGIFDDGPRYARDRASHDLPKGLAGLINSTGPRITAGMLNTRTAVNTDGMNPDDHAYGGGAGDPLFGEFGHDGYDYEGMSRGEFNHRMRGYDPDEASARRREEIEDEDDESGYNWGPIPPEHFGSRLPFDHAAAGRQAGAIDRIRQLIHPPAPEREPWSQTDEGYEHPSGLKVLPTEDGQWQMWSPAGKDNASKAKMYSPAAAPEHLMDWHDYEQGGQPPDWHERPRRAWDGMFPPNQMGPRTADVMQAAPAQQMQPLQGGGFLPGHQVVSIWRGTPINGIVTDLDGPHVWVRYHDGQHLKENPADIQLR